jgi:hypothetical protein
MGHHREPEREPVYDRPEIFFSFWLSLALGSPQLHHLCVAVHGVRWGLTAVGDLENALRFGPWGSMAVNRGFRDRSENHGVPGSNPGPAT